MTRTKFIYLKAWDRMMGSAPYYIQGNQERAEKGGAPEDVIYKDKNGKWVSFSEVTSASTKVLVEKLVAEIREREV